jgi:hypothetical protein
MPTFQGHRIIHGQSLSDLRQILQPDVQLVTCPYPIGPRVLNFLASLDMPSLSSQWDKKGRYDDQALFISPRASWDKPRFGETLVQATLAPFFQGFATHPDLPAFADCLHTMGGDVHQVLRPRQMNGALQLHAHGQTPDQEDPFHTDDSLCTVRALFTFLGKRRTLYRPHLQAPMHEIGAGLLSVHKSRLGGAALLHASPPIAAPQDNRLLYNIDMNGGDCPDSSLAAGIMRSFRASQPSFTGYRSKIDAHSTRPG